MGNPPASARRRQVTLPALAASAAGVAALAYVAAVDPNQSGHYPVCPFLALTGKFCPGCGSLRALHDLMHGDLNGALARNPLLVLAVAVALVWVALQAPRLWGGRPRTPKVGPRVLYGALTLVLVFWVARNVPGWTFLSPV